MKLLSGKPSPPVAVLAKVFDNKAYVFKPADLRIGMPKPEAFRELAHKVRGASDQLLRCGS